MHYGFSKTVDLSFEAAIERVTDELKKEGFGVLTTIDVHATLKKKLDVDFPKYVILGACNPPFAHKALQMDSDIGLLLLCNLIVYEKEGRSVVSAFDPMTLTKIITSDLIRAIAEKMKQRLERVIAEV